MSVGFTNIASLIGQRLLNANQSALNAVGRRLAAGDRIARGADDPAGLIASERLRAELAGLDAETRGLDRAEAVAAVAEGALREVSGLLGDARALAAANANTAGLSNAEREANRLALDSALQAIDRIAATTTFNGGRLLDGSVTLAAAGGSVGVVSASTSELGRVDSGGKTYRLSDARSGGAISGDPQLTLASIRQAAEQVGVALGAIGAFVRNTIEPARRSWAVAFENTTAASSVIRDADAAFESSAWTRARTLRDASLTALTLAQSSPARVSALLG